MQHQRFQILHSPRHRMPMAGSRCDEATAITQQMLGPSAPRRSIERTSAGLLCVRVRLVVLPRRLVVASRVTRGVLTHII
jgi:hypothetical protein